MSKFGGRIRRILEEGFCSDTGQVITRPRLFVLRYIEIKVRDHGIYFFERTGCNGLTCPVILNLSQYPLRLYDSISYHALSKKMNACIVHR